MERLFVHKKQAFVFLIVFGLGLITFQAQAADIFVKPNPSAEQSKPKQPSNIRKPSATVRLPSQPMQQKIPKAQTPMPLQTLPPNQQAMTVCTEEDAKKLLEIDSAVKAMAAKPDFSHHPAKWQHFFSDPENLQTVQDLYMRCPMVAFQNQSTGANQKLYKPQ